MTIDDGDRRELDAWVRGLALSGTGRGATSGPRRRLALSSRRVLG